MTYQAKTTPTPASVVAHLEQTLSGEKLREAFVLLEMFEVASHHKPVLWGTSMIRFDSYHYRYASGHQGDSPIIAFAPRASGFSLYLLDYVETHKHLLTNLGPHSHGKACLIIKNLSSIRHEVLQDILNTSYANTKAAYG